MQDKDDNGFETIDENPGIHLGQTATETIDLEGLFSRDLTSSGSFDIREGIWATTFGKVLQVLPVPALLIDDSYNASLKAAIEAINTLLALGKRRPKVAVFGEMKDLGSLSKSQHQSLGAKVAKSKIKYLFTVGKVAQIIAKSARKHKFGGKIINVVTTNEAIKEIKKVVTHKSLVLVKGSRHAHLERIVYGLLHKSTKINCHHCGELK